MKIVKAGVDVERREPVTGETALHGAASRGKSRTIEVNEMETRQNFPVSRAKTCERPERCISDYVVVGKKQKIYARICTQSKTTVRKSQSSLVVDEEEKNATTVSSQTLLKSNVLPL